MATVTHIIRRPSYNTYDDRGTHRTTAVARSPYYHQFTTLTAYITNRNDEKP